MNANLKEEAWVLSTKSAESGKHTIPPAAAGAIFVAFSLLFAGSYAYFKPGFPGSESYSSIARQFYEGGAFTTTYRPPLYPLMLAMTMRLFDNHWQHAALLLNAVSGAAAGILLAMAAARITGRQGAGIAALVLYAAHLVLQLENLAKRETAIYIVLQLVFVLTWQMMQRPALKYPLLGLLAGLLHLTRPTGIVFFIAGLASALLPQGSGIRQKGINSALFCVMFIAAISPWAAATYRLTGRLTIASSHNFGQGLYKGHNRFFFTIVPWADIDVLEPTMEAMLQKKLLDPDADPIFKDMALDYIFSNPGATFLATMLKAAVFVSPFPTPFGTARFTADQAGGALLNFRWRNPAVGLYSAIHFCFLYGLAAVGVRRMKTGSAKEYLVLLLLVGVLSLGIQCVTYSEMRYRLPLDVLIIIPAAAAAAEMFRARFAAVRQRTLPG